MSTPQAPVRVAGQDLSPVDLATAADQVLGLARTGRTHLVVTVNADQALHVAEDPDLAEVFASATFRFADGAPVVALSRLLGRPLPERVTGADLMPAVCARAAGSGLRVAIVGGRPGVGVEAVRRLTAAYPGLEVAAVLAPPMGFENDAEQDRLVLDALDASRPDIVFVCLGSPKQERWVAGRVDVLPSAVYLGVGAAVDFAAGAVRRAPVRLQRAGLEWAWRLLQERRLANRYLVRGPRFLLLAARELAAARKEAA